MQRPKKMDCFKNILDVVGKNKRVDVFLATLGLIGLLFPFTQHLFFPLTPYIKEEFGSIDTITQLTISVPSFIMALMTLIYGSISDRCGRRPVLLTGIIFIYSRRSTIRSSFIYYVTYFCKTDPRSRGCLRNGISARNCPRCVRLGTPSADYRFSHDDDINRVDGCSGAEQLSGRIR